MDATGLPALLLWLFTGIFPHPAHADRIYYHQRQVHPGHHPGRIPFPRVEILFEGRVLSVPRSRIESIEYESSEENLAAVMKRVAEALQREDPAEAREAYRSRARTGYGRPSPPISRRYEEEIRRLSTHGTSEQRRANAERLLNQALEEFDRIQLERGLEFLLQIARNRSNLPALPRSHGPAADPDAARPCRPRPRIFLRIPRSQLLAPTILSSSSRPLP
jgi:hypothetical protein